MQNLENLLKIVKNKCVFDPEILIFLRNQISNYNHLILSNKINGHICKIISKILKVLTVLYHVTDCPNN